MKYAYHILLGGIVAVLLLSLGTLVNILSFYNAQGDAVHDCAVVFGAAVWPGGVASDALRDRVRAAIDVYHDGRVSCIVFSGAPSAYRAHEVDAMLSIAREHNIAFTDIELDYHGLNTKRTIANLDPERSYLFVSNGFHLARIHLLARQVGLFDYELYSSAYRRGHYRREPYFVLREIIAFWYYAL